MNVEHCGVSEEKGYLLPTLARKIALPTFRLNAPVIIREKVKKVRTNITISASTGMEDWKFLAAGSL